MGILPHITNHTNLPRPPLFIPSPPKLPVSTCHIVLAEDSLRSASMAALSDYRFVRRGQHVRLWQLGLQAGVLWEYGTPKHRLCAARTVR